MKSVFAFLRRLGVAVVAFALVAIATPRVSAQDRNLSRPKMVIGIVVDQMRYDYLYRYYDDYGPGGFSRFLDEGFNCRDHHYHYSNTSTGAGHASVYSGSAPAIHGIIGNDWFDPIEGKSVNCVGDDKVSGVGKVSGSAGSASPHRLLVPTITDQLRISSNLKAKTISIALKDRASILPGGHSANGAYWYNGSNGTWITSTFYMNELPKWVQDFNKEDHAAKYLRQGWSPLYSSDRYTESTSDDQSYEEGIVAGKNPVFPYELKGKSGVAYNQAGASPWGNALTKDMAIAAIKGEDLGKRGVTDFLAISFSAPDGVGHRYGPNSVEQQDIYLRLDRDLADLFAFVDGWIGKNSYTVFLTADHGVIEVPEFLQAQRIPAYRLSVDSLHAVMDATLKKEFGEGDWIRSFSALQLYMNKTLLRERSITVQQVHAVIREKMLTVAGVADVLDLARLGVSSLNPYQRKLYMNMVNSKRSGDLQIILEPGWITRRPLGTTHGSSYNYDTHVPFVLFGWGIKKGETLRRTEICDITPTIAALLHIIPPGGSIGSPVEEALKEQ